MRSVRAATSKREEESKQRGEPSLSCLTALRACVCVCVYQVRARAHLGFSHACRPRAVFVLSNVRARRSADAPGRMM